MYKVKAVFSSSQYKFVEDVYGSGKAATWDSKEQAEQFAKEQTKCFGIRYDVVKIEQK